MRRALSGALIVTLLAARAAFAQDVRRELPGFDFTPDGVWRVKARQVRALREQLLSRGDFARLNAPAALRAPAWSAAAVTDTLRAPAILFRFRDTDTTAQRDTAQYNRVLFAQAPPSGRPYTLRRFYEEMANELFSIQGQAIGWVTLTSGEAQYVGPASGCTPFGTCNGVWSDPAFAALQAGLQEAVLMADPGVDFGQFDNDGPDGVPNSQDDDGTVDIVLFVHASPDGACRGITNNNHPWSHRSSLSVSTADPRTAVPGQRIRVTNYIMQSGLGGTTNCDTTQIMAIGTTAHELGHGLGLPDFYDTNQDDGDDSEGIGQWGLMGSGNYTTATSPSHMESFSRSQLGWLTVRPLAANGTYAFGPTTSWDTAMLVRPTAPNPRGEYFLLENRQPVLSDTAMTRIMGPGLLVWHFDSTQYARGFDLNSGPIHALWLMQADGLNQLRSSVQGVRNRGDAGDPYPGSADNTAFALSSNPAALLNATGNPYAGFVVDSIRQVVPDGEVTFRVRFGGLSTVRASDTTAQIRIRGAPFFVFSDVFSSGDTLTVSMDSAQTRGDARARFTFVSWSDSGARTHVLTMTANDSTFTAFVNRAFRLQVSVSGLATPVPGFPLDTFKVENDSVVLDAGTPPLTLFAGWTGDTTAISPRIVVRMTRPFTIIASYSPVALDSVVGQLTTGTGLSLNQRAILDAQGNQNGLFDLGDFVAWLDRSGTVVDAATMERAMRGGRR
jgi:M6 family metalloprotease-like protein